MSGSDQRVRIVQLYPQELGVTGDRGNVRALEVRLERAGVSVESAVIAHGDELPSDADVIVIGNGPLSAMRGVIEDLRGRRAALVEAIAGGAAVLAIGAGAELLSEGVQLLDGERLEGIGVLPFRVERTRDRRVGYIVADTPDGRIVGFEDHASTWHLSATASAYGRVVAGKGSFTVDGARGEAVREGAVFAANVQGPLLPLNPWLTDEILRIAAARRGAEYARGEGHVALDTLAAGARAAIEERVDGEVFTYMQV